MKYKRIYDKHGNLEAYECEKGRIEVYYCEVTASGYVPKDYYANGWRFSTLREAKKELESI